MIIDPEGLFNGERLAACSDIAQLYWPRLYLGSNSLARVELSYAAIVAKIFRNFQKVPKSSELWEAFREYEANYLAILYEVEGVWWCQFDSPKKYLPRHNSRRDLQSPAPSAQAIKKHSDGYILWKSSKSLLNQSFRKSAEISETFGNFPLERRGVGVGGGVGVGEELPNFPNGKFSSSDVSPDTSSRRDPPADDGFDWSLTSGTEDSDLDQRQRELAAVREVFKYYLQRFRKNPKTYPFTDVRRQKGLARLGEALRIAKGNLPGAVQLMKAAIDQLSLSDWHNGRSPRSDGQEYTSWEKHLFHSENKFTEWLQKAEKREDEERAR